MSSDSRTLRVVAAALVLLMATSAVAPILGGAQSTSGGASPGVQDAKLTIQQPEWASSDVQTTKSGNTTVYSVQGERQNIQPLNFDRSDVIDTEVQPDSAELTYNQQMGHYVFRASQNGTYTVSWLVQETRVYEETTDNETVTRTENVTVRYEAQIRVSKTQMRHIPRGEMSQTQRDAQNWTALKNTWQDIAPDKSMETLTQTATNLLQARYNLSSYLTGTWGAIILTIATSISGLILLGLDRLRELASFAWVRRKLNRQESLDADRADIEDELDRLDMAEKQRDMVNWDIDEIIPDDIYAAEMADALEAENANDAWVQLNAILQPRAVFHDRLQAMGLMGYAAAVSWDDASQRLSARLLRPPEERSTEDIRDDEVVVPLHDDISFDGDWDYEALPEPGDETVDHVDAILDILDWNDDLLYEFDMAEADYDREKFRTHVDGTWTLEELTQEVAGQRNRIEDEERFSKLVLELFEEVERHHYTTSRGQPRTLRVKLNHLLSASTLLADTQQAPLAHCLSDQLRTMLRLHDPMGDAQDALVQSREGRFDATND